MEHSSSAGFFFFLFGELAAGLETWPVDEARSLYAILETCDKPKAIPANTYPLHKQEEANVAGELREIFWPSVCDDASGSIQLQDRHEANPKCKCPPIEVDEQRARYIGSEALKRSKPLAPNQFQSHTGTHSLADLAPLDGQSAIFGLAGRRNLLARKLARGELAEQVLYVLQGLLEEAQACLSGCLAVYTSQASIHLSRLLSRESSNQCMEEFCIPYSHHEPMIREPVPWSGRVRAAQRMPARSCNARMGSADSGWASSENGSMEHLHPVSEEAKKGVRLSFGQLMHFRASKPIQTLVEDSCRFFATLIEEDALFQWLDRPTSDRLLSQRQLQLMACVEFQKLRSQLRYQWLSDCQLHLREAHQMLVSANVQRMASTLLRHLLRDEFLKRALERLCELLEAHQSMLNTGSRVRHSWKLQVAVALTQAADDPSLAAASLPQQELKDTLDAVVRELVGACDKLPNLDPNQPLNSYCEQQTQKLSVLNGSEDNLLEHFRARIHHLVDSGFSLSAPVSWLAQEHQCCLNLINRIRLAPVPTNLSGCHLSAVERIAQLGAARGQLEELDTQAKVLQCNLGLLTRDLGLVVLDCAPLNKSLLESVRKEQLMLERIVVDDSLKLLHQLRLQFEEIQLGVDLDTVVEDYLSERRRALAAATHSSAGQHLQVYNEEESIGGIVVSDVGLGEEQKKQVGSEVEDEEESEWDEELLMRLEGGLSTVHMQLAALTGGGGPETANKTTTTTTTTTTRESGITDSSLPQLTHRSSPIPAGIECRLLVECYQFLDELLGGQLTSLRQDLIVFFESLIFMGEQGQALWADLLEAGDSLSNQWALAGELVQAARQLGSQLERAQLKLTSARERLTESNLTRSLNLSRLVIEFRLLINGVGQRRLPGEGEAQASLDSVQEAANWTRQLEIRARYLSFQNRWIAREAELLSNAASLSRRMHVCKRSPEPSSLENNINTRGTSEVCAKLLARWSQLAKLLAGLWTLAERFETQQVKWLNSDLKQLDYRQLASVLEELKSTLGQLQEAALYNYDWEEGGSASREQSHRQVFETNLTVLQWRLNQFELLRMPLFRYLAGRHLLASQWTKLASLADQNHPRVGALSTCTTLAQLLEYGIDRRVDEIEAMAERERVEREIERFLELEFRSGARPGKQHRGRHLAAGLQQQWFEGWSEPELVLVAQKYLERKMSTSPCDSELYVDCECGNLARALVTYHALAGRFLSQSLHLNLISPSSSSLSSSSSSPAHQLYNKKGRPLMILLPFRRLSSATFINSSLFVELLRLAADRWLEGRRRLQVRAQRVSCSLEAIEEHLKGLSGLMERARELKDNELRKVSGECELTMCQLECQSAHMQLEREILATKEALALREQRQALGARDECVRQVTERAIPSLRAAAGALDSLDGRSLRFLCALKPAPTEPVRVVLEAVSLVRCHIVDEEARMQPERRFDALTGRMLEDYWPPTSRLLNGTHSARLVADLRQVSKRPLSNQLMRFIRRHYLSSSGFRLACSSQPAAAGRQVSRECVLLAKWLLAVDVFCRVINIVRPRYREYLEAERKLNGLLAEVNNRRRQLELVAGQLRNLEDSLERQKALRTCLADSLDQCRRQLSQAEGTRWELLRKRSACVAKLERIRSSQSRLVNRCALRATLWLYGAGLPDPCDSFRLERLLKTIQYNTPQRAQMSS